ncbi:apolipoprotein D-like isoform X2 [Pecten maximus]|uniref:apolipoprotein D-like isoform X2 n=1 Tax=Pecten maximus TaxID=6579 RepID=UPI00145860DA|nr:apolipoprotein D-like isoform X2 [Pecten maximus]XP_033752877.1 apolipoprotein D-like isoform X2 [Pecten maximus]XP_033752878.1 apolipoprotein D-like isoform X2 [Pecten maximus]XP_033752879.1 apolipoprotein D-like isoform X2 [Pecten maximus]
MALLQLFFLIGTATFINAACPDVPVKPEFDATKFAGMWYWTEWLNNGMLSSEIPGVIDCVTSNFTVTESGNMSVGLTWREKMTNMERSTEGRLIQKDSPNHFESTITELFKIPIGGIYVLDTVARSWAVVYTCRNIFFGLFTIETAWLLHRNPAGRTGRQRNIVNRRWQESPNLGFILDTDQFNTFNNTECQNQ